MIPSIASLRYKSVQVKTSSPGDLLVLLYEGLFRFLGEAAVAMRRDDRATAGERIDRSLAILGELAASLRHDAAPELCDNLLGLYMFSMDHLVQSNLRQEPERIDAVIRILTPLRDAWKQAVAASATIPA
jgi:flagellar protein FliS